MARAFWIRLGLLTLLACILGVYILNEKSQEGINAFGVFGSILTVVGTSVAIAQVLELRRRAVAIEQEVKNARADFFRWDHSTMMASCVERLHFVIRLTMENRFEACSIELKYIVADLRKMDSDALVMFGDQAANFSKCVQDAQAAQSAAVKWKPKGADPAGTRERIDQVASELIMILSQALSQLRSKQHVKRD